MPDACPGSAEAKNGRKTFSRFVKLCTEPDAGPGSAEAGNGRRQFVFADGDDLRSFPPSQPPRTATHSGLFAEQRPAFGRVRAPTARMAGAPPPCPGGAGRRMRSRCACTGPACTARSGRLHLPKSAIRETAAGQCGGRHASGSPFPYGLFGDRAGRETHPFKAAFCAIRRNWPRAPRGGTGGCGCRSGLPLRGWPAGRR